MKSGQIVEKIQAIVDAGFTQKQLAERVGVTQGHISKMLSGSTMNPEPRLCLALAGLCPPQDRKFWLEMSGIDRLDIDAIEAVFKMDRAGVLSKDERELIEWWRDPKNPMEDGIRNVVRAVLKAREER